MRKVALDLGKRKTTLSEAQDGRVVRRQTVRRLSELSTFLGPDEPPAVVAIEACRDAWHVHDVLTEWGHEVRIVDTTRVRQLGIGQHGRKTDRIDADLLALALDRGALPLAHVLSARARRVREELTVRSELVKTRARYITQMRALLQARGVTVPRCATHNFVKTVLRMELSEAHRALVSPLLRLLPHLDVQIARVELTLHELYADEPAVPKLATIPGVAMLVAMAFVAVVDTPHRFRNAAQVASYIGLTPRERSSGGKRRLGSITKQGNPYLRAMLVQAGWLILRSRAEDPLVLWAKRVAERRGKRVAVIAVARRLARLMWAMWRHGSVYMPELLAERSASGHQRHARDLERHAEVLKTGVQKLDKQRKTSARRGRTAHELIDGSGGAMAL